MSAANLCLMSLWSMDYAMFFKLQFAIL